MRLDAYANGVCGGIDVPRGTRERLKRFVDLLLEANQRQNLIGSSTVADVWTRHIEDSLQLLEHAPPEGLWLDIGSGAGLPGLVIAIVRPAPMMLVEPRRLRAEFLHQIAENLGMTNILVLDQKVETLPARTDMSVISARAVAPLSRLFAMAHHLSNPETTWLLSKGRKAIEEVEIARRAWQGEMEMVESRTDPDASIVIARHISPKVKS